MADIESGCEVRLSAEQIREAHIATMRESLDFQDSYFYRKLADRLNALLAATKPAERWTCPDCGYDSMPYPALGQAAHPVLAPVKSMRPVCGAPNRYRNYLCNKEPHASGDHVHSFINSDGERGIYWWPAPPAKETQS